MFNEVLNKKSDPDLYKEFLLGNRDAFNLLMIRHRKALTNFIMYYVKNVEIAEDIAQDSFLYIIINKKYYDFKFSFKTYLYTIAKSRALNYLKREKKTIPLTDIDIDNFVSELNVEDEVINNVDREQIISAIRTLKKDYQIIVYLYYFQNFKYKEISEILNISMSKTKMSLNRAKKNIKKILKEEKKHDDRSRIY